MRSHSFFVSSFYISISCRRRSLNKVCSCFKLKNRRPYKWESSSGNWLTDWKTSLKSTGRLNRLLNVVNWSFDAHVKEHCPCTSCNPRSSPPLPRVSPSSRLRVEWRRRPSPASCPAGRAAGGWGRRTGKTCRRPPQRCGRRRCSWPRRQDRWTVGGRGAWCQKGATAFWRKYLQKKKYLKPCQTTKKCPSYRAIWQKNNLQILIFFQFKQHIYWQILHQLVITDLHQKNTFSFLVPWIFLYTSIVKKEKPTIL